MISFRILNSSSLMPPANNRSPRFMPLPLLCLLLALRLVRRVKNLESCFHANKFTFRAAPAASHATMAPRNGGPDHAGDASGKSGKRKIKVDGEIVGRRKFEDGTGGGVSLMLTAEVNAPDQVLWETLLDIEHHPDFISHCVLTKRKESK